MFCLVEIGVILEKKNISYNIPLWALGSCAVHCLWVVVLVFPYLLTGPDPDFFSFLKYMAATLPTSIFIFPSFGLGSLRTKTALFKAMQATVGQLHVGFREITTTAPIWKIFMPLAFKLQTRRICLTITAAFTPSENDLRQTSRTLLGCLPSEVRSCVYSLLQ